MSVFRVTKKFGLILSGHQRLRIIELAVLMLIGGLLEMCSVSLIMPFTNALMNPGDTMEKWYAIFICDLFEIHSERAFLITAAVLLAGVYIFKNAYLLFEYNLQYRFVYSSMFAMQRRLLNSYIHRPYEYFLKVNSGEIIRIINDDTPGTFVMLSTILNLFTESTVSGLLIAVIFVITPFTTICMASVLLLLLVMISMFIKPVLRRAGTAHQTSAAGMNKWLLQSIHGIKDLKIMGKEDFFQDNFASYGHEFVNSLRKYQVLGIIPRFLIEAVSMGTMFIVVAVMISQGSSVETIVPVLTAAAMAAIRLLPSVNRISSSMASIAYSEPMLDKLIENLQDMDTFDMDIRKDKKQNTKNGADESPFLKEGICLHDIYFHYSDAEADILSGASMEMGWGESVGIIGSSGAGKSTAVDIILGLLKPQRGNILADGTDIWNDIRGWNDKIGFIPQMIFILDDTIKHNVCFGVEDEDISEERMWRSLEEASLAEFIRSLPEGADTQIGERGVRLSGGQRQRIGIARALYQNPSVLVFDEATSALDSETEAAIMKSINSLHGQKTMIIIAHRVSTLENCDHIYSVKNGKIVLER